MPITFTLCVQQDICADSLRRLIFQYSVISIISTSSIRADGFPFPSIYGPPYPAFSIPPRITAFRYSSCLTFRGFNKGRGSKFRVGSQDRQTPEEGRRKYRPKRCGNSNNDEDHSPKFLHDKNHQALSQKFRQLMIKISVLSKIFFTQFENFVSGVKVDSLKLQILKSYWRGYPLQIIQNLLISNVNFSIAADLLKVEFLDIDLIKKTYIPRNFKWP